MFSIGLANNYREFYKKNKKYTRKSNIPIALAATAARGSLQTLLDRARS